MYVFLVCLYIIVAVLYIVCTGKHNKLTADLINEIRKENYLLREQNKKLSDIITKYGIK